MQWMLTAGIYFQKTIVNIVANWGWAILDHEGIHYLLHSKSKQLRELIQKRTLFDAILGLNCANGEIHCYFKSLFQIEEKKITIVMGHCSI